MGLKRTGIVVGHGHHCQGGHRDWCSRIDRNLPLSLHQRSCQRARRKIRLRHWRYVRNYKTTVANQFGHDFLN
ncbi:hypothetical protein BC936DRAFT_147988 [Jimgerdemannia flammicorona]|uniref:Uncharacterized protein n=1 Tax=Jimgerdemannia flammicorona TaxID=994334 RepID=A0A433DKP8_9FUNG|nr:hypothetical protein BC936DRAFT_147988 [Jimgerdemannia flammicorona]